MPLAVGLHEIRVHQLQRRHQFPLTAPRAEKGVVLNAMQVVVQPKILPFAVPLSL